MWSSYFFFSKKTIPVPVRQSWLSLSPLLASLQNPSPRKTFHLIRKGFLVERPYSTVHAHFLKT